MKLFRLISFLFPIALFLISFQGCNEYNQGLKVDSIDLQKMLNSEELLTLAEVRTIIGMPNITFESADGHTTDYYILRKISLNLNNCTKQDKLKIIYNDNDELISINHTLNDFNNFSPDSSDIKYPNEPSMIKKILFLSKSRFKRFKL